MLKDETFKKVTKNFYFTLVYNRGAFFGFLKNRQSLLKYSILLAIILMIWILSVGIYNNENTEISLSLSIIIGGAIANFLDRLHNGYVTDFLYIKYRRLPVFNIADVSIFAGTILLVFAEVLGK